MEDDQGEMNLRDVVTSFIVLIDEKLQQLIGNKPRLIAVCDTDNSIIGFKGASGSDKLDSCFNEGENISFLFQAGLTEIPEFPVIDPILFYKEEINNELQYRFLVDFPEPLNGRHLRCILITIADPCSNNLVELLKDIMTSFDPLSVNDSIFHYFHKPYVYEQKIFDAMSDGFMVVDRSGRVRYLNVRGCDILGISQDFIGSYLTDLTLFEPELMEVLKTGTGWTNREFIIDLKTKKSLHLVKTAVPLFDDYGIIVGVVDIFKEIKEVRNLVNKMVGAQSGFTFQDIVYESRSMQEVISVAKKIAVGDSSVLIQGESGTGKELFAHAIHEYSSRRRGPFITVDCATLPGELVESELFGYVGGAFTGARRGGRPGKFEMAEQGTVFMDEIGEMSLNIQKKFLRVLQSHAVTRIGDHIPIQVDIRIIAATNRNLEDEVVERNFREDLFYRMNVINLQIPPLRSRKEDILPTARYFLRSIGTRLGKGNITLSKETEDILIRYDWPGNVRQLKNIIERALVLSDDEVLSPHHLPEKIIKGQKHVEINEKNHDGSQFFNLKDSEKMQIQSILEKFNGNKVKAADSLGIARSTLYEKLRKYGIS